MNQQNLASLIISIIILIIVIILIIIVCYSYNSNKDTNQQYLQNPQAAALAYKQKNNFIHGPNCHGNHTNYRLPWNEYIIEGDKILSEMNFPTSAYCSNDINKCTENQYTCTSIGNIYFTKSVGGNIIATYHTKPTTIKCLNTFTPNANMDYYYSNNNYKE